MRILIFLVILLLPISGFTVPAQQASTTAPVAAVGTDRPFALTIDNIMRGAELVGYEPRDIRWSVDGRYVYFQWKSAGEPHDKDFDTYVVERDGQSLRKLTEEEAHNAPPARGEPSKDKTSVVYVEGGDVFLYDAVANRRRPLVRTTEIESNAHFTRNPLRIYFTRANNLFVLSLNTGELVQMTDIRAAGAPSNDLTAGRAGRRSAPLEQSGAPPARGTDSQEFLKKEERALLDAVRRRAEKRERDEATAKRKNPRKPFQLQPRQSIISLQLSPNEKFVIAVVSETTESGKSTLVPNYITETAYTEDIPGRPKAGDPPTTVRLAVLSVDTGEVHWVDHGQKVTASRTEHPVESATHPTYEKMHRSSGERPAPETAPPRSNETARPPAEPRARDVQLFQPVWSEDGTRAVLLARSADNKDRWILALDPATGGTRVIVADHDDAWIGGPGAYTFGWMPDDGQIYFLSERSGYAHLYTVAYDGGDPKPLTSGAWEVTDVRLREDKSRFILTTHETHPGERHVYEMALDGGPRTRLTSMPGQYQIFPSPDDTRLAMIYSYTNKPPEFYLQESRPGAPAVRVTSSPAPEFWRYPWTDAPIVTFAARDGATVHARLYKPKSLAPGGPAVIFVHGAGYLQNVHRGWSRYFHEYMFHHLLTEHGYTVMDLDYRGSAGYGRDWRTAIYRHMGSQDLSDQVDAVAWLVREHGVDARRIGIYGGSYGGFITLMAMFTQPDVFAAGAALRPVTDWAHYASSYTTNILNRPPNDAEAYRRSSPIYFADGLKGALLICHGMVDINVHFQDTVRLVQKLIELRKTNWELAVYPIEDHAFIEPSSWADEYKRIFRLFETHLKKDRAATSSAK